MDRATQPRALTQAIATLRALAPDSEREAALGLSRRAADRRLRVLVAGEAKRGKSTLINRLVGRDLLPTGVTPMTAVATTVRFDAEHDHVRVTYLDGRVETRAVDDLPDLVTEHGNPSNALGIAEVTVLLSGDPFGPTRVELVDTPGTGSVFEHNTRTARDTYDSLDAVIVVVAADPPISGDERDLLQDLAGRAVRTFVVLNKTDQLTPVELSEAVAFTITVCADAGVSASAVTPMSARSADQGYAAFRAELVDYLRQHGERDTFRALATHSLRLAHRLRDDVRIQLRAADLDAAGEGERVTVFLDRISVLSASSQDVKDRCRATAVRLQRELDTAATQLVRDLTIECRRRTTDFYADLPDGLSAAELEHQGRHEVTRQVAEAVTTWRLERAQALEDGLNRLVGQVNDEHRRHLDQMRTATRDLLDLVIAMESEPVALRTVGAFWFAFDPPTGWEAPGAATMRRHGPGAAGRAKERVLVSIPSLVDRQVGRARADLQTRLAETLRDLMNSLSQGLGSTIGALEETLRTQLRRQTRSGPERDRAREQRTERLAELDRVIAELVRDLDPVPSPPRESCPAMDPAEPIVG